MNAIEERERVDFENTLGRHTASLCEFARPYVGRLTKADSGSFLAAALAEAWLRRTDFDPEQESLLLWWEGCLRAAALTRPAWRIWRSSEWVEVPGKLLGKKGQS